MLLLADQDEGKEKKHDALRALHEPPHFHYVTTAGREIENLLSESELQAAASEWLPNEKPSLSAIERANYKDEPLGAYLFNGKHVTTDISAESGTLDTYRKNRLADVLTKLRDNGGRLVRWDTMSNDAQSLATQVYEFIASHNVDPRQGS